VNWDTDILNSRGRVHHTLVDVCAPSDTAEAIEATRAPNHRGIFAYGGGRGYGDTASNNGGRSILTSRLNDIHEFDSKDGRIVYDPGATFELLVQWLLQEMNTGPLRK